MRLAGQASAANCDDCEGDERKPNGEVNAADDASDQEAAAGWSKVRVGRADGAVLDPPADTPDGDTDREDPVSEVADAADERDESHNKEDAEQAKSGAEVAGIGDGGADAACEIGGFFCCCGVDGGSAERALLHGGVDGLAAVGAGKDLNAGGKAQAAGHVFGPFWIRYRRG